MKKTRTLLPRAAVFDGKLLRSFRERKGMTQVVLAGLVGLSQNLIYKMETGRYLPHLKTLFAFVNILELDPFELLALLRLNFFPPQALRIFRAACRKADERPLGVVNEFIRAYPAALKKELNREKV